MEIAMVGLGKMGANMTQRLIQGGHRLVVSARSPESVAAVVEKGATGASSLEELVAKLARPCVVWTMVPSGEPTESVISQLGELMGGGDIIIDGGNSNYKDTMRRAAQLSERGIQFVDVGTSGGVWGLAEGYSMMVGGSKESVERIRSVLETLAPGTEKGRGTYDLGNITIKTPLDIGVQKDVITVHPVQLIIADLYRTYTPLISNR